MASGATIQTDHDDTGAANASATKNIPYDLALTKFKRGETLRLNIECWAQIGNNVDSEAGYGVDPQDRDDIVTASGGICVESAFTTQLKLAVPFIIDI